MRKLILISVLLLASASARAGESRGLVLAASDATAASTTDTLPKPLPPVAKNDAKSEVREPQRPQVSEPVAPRARPRAQARRYEANEATARRIAARYGISW